MVAGSTRTPARPSCSTPSWAERPGKVSRAYPKRRECSPRLVVDVRRDVVGRALGLLARVSHGNPKAEPSAHLDVVLSVATAASTPLCRSVARARCVLVGMVFVACGTRVQFTSNYVEEYRAYRPYCHACYLSGRKRAVCRPLCRCARLARAVLLARTFLSRAQHTHPIPSFFGIL